MQDGSGIILQSYVKISVIVDQELQGLQGPRTSPGCTMERSYFALSVQDIYISFIFNQYPDTL